MKTLTLNLLAIFTFVLANNSIAQNQDDKLDEIIADTACACFSSVDTSLIKTRANVIKNSCLQEAIAKNKNDIQKSHRNDNRSFQDDDLKSKGIQSEMLIRVQNILSKECESYQLFEKSLRTQRKGKSQRKR